MDPELVELAQRELDDEHAGRAAQQRQHHEQRRVEHVLERALAQRRGEVEFFALVVRRMHRPQEIDLVRPAVRPVIDKVEDQERPGPGPRRARRRLPQRQMAEHPAIGQQHGGLGEHFQRHGPDTASHAGQAVGQ